MGSRLSQSSSSPSRKNSTRTLMTDIERDELLTRIASHMSLMHMLLTQFMSDYKVTVSRGYGQPSTPLSSTRRHQSPSPSPVQLIPPLSEERKLSLCTKLAANNSALKVNNTIPHACTNLITYKCCILSLLVINVNQNYLKC